MPLSIYLALFPLALLPAQEAPAATAQESGEELPVRFRVRALENLRSAGCQLGEQAVAINDRGEVVGSVCRGERSRAAYWSAEGELTLVDTSESRADSFAVGLSDEGEVVGCTPGARGVHAFRWTADSGSAALAFVPGARPLAVGADGTIAFSHPVSAFLAGGTWRQGLGSTSIEDAERDVLVRGLNRTGGVTGIVGGGPLPARAFRWSFATGLAELGVPAGFAHAHGNAINDSGFVVGLCRNDQRDQATLWAPNSDPALLPYFDEEHTQSAALGVNEHGWIVGYEHAGPGTFARSRAVVWIDGDAFELDRLLVEVRGAEVHVTVAWDINESGQIAARGLLNGVQRALRLDPQ